MDVVFAAFVAGLGGLLAGWALGKAQGRRDHLRLMGEHLKRFHHEGVK